MWTRWDRCFGDEDTDQEERVKLNEEYSMVRTACLALPVTRCGSWYLNAKMSCSQQRGAT